MTYKLDQLNPLDALYDRAKQYPGSIEALAHLMQKSPAVLYKKLERHTESHGLRFDEWEEIQRRLIAAHVPDACAPLRALAYRFGHVAIKLPEVDHVTDKELRDDLVQLFAETGDVPRVIEKALANDDRITPAELAAIEREIEEAMEKLAQVREHVRQRAAQKQQPNHLKLAK